MSDIGITWDNIRARGDWSVTNSDLTQDSPIKSAVIVSLFTDARADSDFVPPDGSKDRRGWWGSTYTGDAIGSRLWQYERAKKAGNTNLPVAIRNAVQDALQWLTDDDVAASVIVQTKWANATAIAIAIQITEPNGDITQFNLSWAWNGI